MNMPTNMTPENAIEILSDATEELEATRRQHRMLDEALLVLNTTVKQWRAMQDPSGPPGAPGGSEDPKKLLTED